jgi:transposase, IS30 family
MQKKSKLTLEERERMFALMHSGKSFREIAALLGRSHTSVSREIRRNKNQHTGEYMPCVAQGKAEKRERIQRKKAPLKSTNIFLYVRRKLRMGWSPETIAGRLKVDVPGEKICTETIYQYIYVQAKHPKEKLFNYLVLHRKKRMRKHGRKVQSSKIPGRIGIEERPEAVALKKEFGHGETDLMEGLRSDKPVVSVTVERSTRDVQLTLLPNKTAKAKTTAVHKDILAMKLITITTDNGTENTNHQDWAVQTYFTTPYHSWEKGTVENTIGRLRKYIPKKTSIASLTQEELRYIQWEMNHTPRKCLGFLTPAQALANELKNPIF